MWEGLLLAHTCSTAVMARLPWAADDVLVIAAAFAFLKL